MCTGFSNRSTTSRTSSDGEIRSFLYTTKRIPAMNNVVSEERLPQRPRGSAEGKNVASAATIANDGSRAARSLYVRRGKRLLDVFAATVALLISAPILLVCAAAIWIESRGPVFYRQRRVGRNGLPFQIVKLRTMRPNADSQGPRLTASGDNRITKVGKILRRTKLDEVPQFFNVLQGSMSLVGPRPELPEFVAEYTAEERQVLEVKPGITGPASICYIDEERLLADASDRVKFYIDKVMRDKLQLDLSYCRNVSFPADLRILLGTFTSMFSILGSRASATAERSVGRRLDGHSRSREVKQ